MSRLRGSIQELSKLLSSSAAPVYAIDHERRIVYCNAACAAWTGVAAEELIGQQCQYHWPADSPQAQRAAAGLCPPPEVFAGARRSAAVHRATDDGALVRRMGNFLALGDEIEGNGVLAVLDLEDLPSSGAVAPLSNAPDAQAEELHAAVAAFRARLAGCYSLDRMIGSGPSATLAREQALVAAACQANVVIWGPPGSGRQHLAKAIHYRRSADSGRALVSLFCSALPAELLRSTLQAMIAKASQRQGPLDTLLLGDVDQMPLEVQAELAAALSTRKIALPIIATASVPLESLEGLGEFRHDLACQLSTIIIRLDPLSDRLADLPILAQTFLEEVNAEGDKQVGGFTAAALDLLVAYPWPGNVEELVTIVREAHDNAASHEIEPAELPKRIHLAADAARYPRKREETIELEDFLARVEKELIERAMKRAGGNKSKAAKLLGLTRPRLYRRLVQLGLAEEESEQASEHV